MKENLPLELLNKHRESLGLEKPCVFENENDLFGINKTQEKSAVVFLPKSKTLIDMTLSLVSSTVKTDGTIILVGTKKGGIESAKKIYEEIIGPVEQKIVGNHSALYVGKNKKLNAGKKIEDFFSIFPLAYKGKEIKIASLPGVFSAGELDPGTKILLNYLPLGAKKFLDLACGGGIVGTFYKTFSPQTSVDLSDSSLLAIEATKKTLEINTLEGNVIISDVFSNIEEKYDLIAVNPPFHKGIDTDYSFIDMLVMEAPLHLEKHGKLFVVANNFLPYIEKLKTIGPATEIYRDSRYVLYVIEKVR